MEPNKLNIAKWIVALRSGKYAQTTHILRDQVGYCCLGVACDISDLGNWQGKHYRTEEHQSQTALPTEVYRWLGVERNPKIARDLSAQVANDCEHMSFTEIADSLEALYLEGKKAEDVVEAASAESEAWRKLAELFDSQANDCSPYLCDAINRHHTNWPYLAADDVRLAMLDRIRFQIAGAFSAYPYIDGFDNFSTTLEQRQEVKEARVLACLMFAEQAAEGE